ncbi:glycosyltransferase family 2 protein [Pseudooceanicola marinus]|uniref:glycosyltransferase family 2 protein n=1 Tax=Pseudooceanicola marinus TaxID=396013 RepID=UPI001CD6456B|nr:glycosyltransferase family 2 protein [Pseudooceanicola marinus]MCA1337225.1 glycosyltransferase family 2 protein [Pseudooceanicola marinus]
MYFSTFEEFLRNGRDLLAKGPVAMIFAEDEVELDTTLRHHRDAGFAQVLLFAPDAFTVPDDLKDLPRIAYSMVADNALSRAVNAVIEAAPAGTWLYYCYNAEYLFYPFCETRTVGELLTFHAEERRDAMLSYVIDLYADDLEAHPLAVSIERAHLDRAGYYALARPDAWGNELARQLNFYGGLRWRYEEHIPEGRRKIDRVSLFRARPGLVMGEDYLFNDPEYNTYACPWHHNLTACICSFRTAKALKSNPGSRFDIGGFTWHNSARFEWHSRQLLDLGLMEPGQWF